MPITSPIPEYEPVVSSNRWNTEKGFIDDFSNPNPGLIPSAAGHGLVGLGLGGSAGALAGSNPLVSGLSTGAGSTLGYLLANALAKNSPNQETYSGLGSLAGGALGLGGSLLAPKDKKKVKLASVPDILNKMYGQLPEIHLPESLAGGAIGAGGGWLYDKLNPAKKDQGKHKLNRMLAGAGIGALGANEGMDRVRRYVSNNLVPENYGDKTDQLKPKSLKHIWDSAFADKPQQPGMAEYLAGKYSPMKTQPENDDLAILAGKRELERRDFGVHTPDPKKDIWAKQPSGGYSINPAFGDAGHQIRTQMYPDQNDPHWTRKFLQDPMSVVGAINNGPDETGKTGFRGHRPPGYMTDTVGGQRIAMYPHAVENNPLMAGKNNYVAKIQDRWNVSLRGYEQKQLWDSIKASLFGGPKPNITSNYVEGPSDQVAKGLGHRLLYDTLLSRHRPWVTQRLGLQKLPPIENQPNADTGYMSIPTDESGHMYTQGKTIGTYNPKGTIDYHDPDIISALSKGEWKPPVSPQVPFPGHSAPGE